MPTTCKIYFENNPHKIVFSGQKLQMTVRIKLTKDIKIRGVNIHLRGTTHVRFSDRYGNYAADEDVLDITKCLLNRNAENQVLPMGTHDFGFVCTLPDDLPSSFKSDIGSIKYTANVVLCTPFWPDKKFEEKFIVLKRLDLNDYPSLRGEVSKNNWTMSVRIPSGGYVGGQSISFRVAVLDIQAHRPPCRFVAYIMRRTVYNHKTAQGENPKLFLSIVSKQIVHLQRSERNTLETIPAQNLIVPKVLPTDTERNHPIKTSYFFSIKGFKGSKEYNMKEAFVSLDMPITIGTIPFDDDTSATVNQSPTGISPSAPEYDIRLLEHRPMNPSAPQFPDDDTVSIRTYASTPPPFPDDDFELPSYEEAMFMDEIDMTALY